MCTTQTDFEQLMERVRAGSQEAAQELLERYSDPIRRVVRRHLHRRLRRQFDSLDFVQSVWASFFQLPAERYSFPTPKALVAFLSQVAYNKVVEAFRQRFQTAKHDLTRERSLHNGNLESPSVQLREPTPSQLAIAEECWERLLAGQPPRYRRILEMLRQGHSHREIGEKLGLHPKVVQRLLRKLGAQMERP
jgi:RNA polymerase sigma-70 factor (ECF subfamily)